MEEGTGDFSAVSIAAATATNLNGDAGTSKTEANTGICMELRENLSSGFWTKSGRNRAVLPQKMTKGLRLWIKDIEELYYIYR